MEGVSVNFHREFSGMTGFKRNIALSKRSKKVCDIQRGVHSMYVCCDVYKKIVVGDSLLKKVVIRGNHRDYTHIHSSATHQISAILHEVCILFTRVIYQIGQGLYNILGTLFRKELYRCCERQP